MAAHILSPHTEATGRTDGQPMDEGTVEEVFQTRLAEERARLGGRRPNVLVCGYTGCGKTSLIQAVCGDLVPEGAIADARPATTTFDEYASEHIRIWDSRGLEPGEGEEGFVAALRGFVHERQSDPDIDNHIHLMWYAVQGCGARITDCDLHLIRDVMRPSSVIVALTKADIARPEQIEGMARVLAEAGVDPQQVVATSDIRSGARGCRKLMALTHRMLPAAYRDAFMEAQRVDREARIRALDSRRGRAGAVIAASVAAAAGVGATPIPVADAALLIPIQTGMIASLAALYGLRREAIRHAVLPFVARAAGIYTSSSLLKLLPGLGSLVNAAVAGSITGAMGWFTQRHFEAIAVARATGAPIPELGLDLEAFRRYYRDGRRHKA